ncbi:gamma-butyrobetaine dioxygenase-like [Chironomus tepperi]|uniref:gamma-butyrobetaine dioxygenase-like n=1 Tax=Chironomus tepperi TaxID=113505 RepID=UPI00391F74DF
MFQNLLKNLVIRNGNSLQKFLPLYSKKLQPFSTSLINNYKVNASINVQNETIELTSNVKDSDSIKSLKFPFVWLRDNCKCEKCHHPSSSSRIINWEKFDVTVKPKNINYDDKKNILKVEWNDKSGHISEYEYDWLDARNFSDENRNTYLNKYYRPAKILLNKFDLQHKLQYFDYQKVIKDDMELYKWLHSMITHGIAIITDVPETESEVRVLSNRVAFIRRTHYGEEFIVKAKEGTSNVAYLSENLQMHTDLPYYDYAPGANLLHCLVQAKSEGAENLLTDGFYIAEKMRNEYPEEFEILTKVLVNWSDIGQEDNIHFHSLYRAPMICLDYDGNIERINHSIPQRDSFFTTPLKNVKLWYKALALFVDLIYNEAVEMKTKEGTILCFDNSRLIHGRKKYQDQKDNRRHIIGAYLDWDELYSRYRVLQNKFEI